MIYEVNCMISKQRRDEYFAWLQIHIRQLLDIDGFERATVSDLQEDERLPETHVGFCVQYFLKDRVMLDRYLSEFAPAMRADGVKRFGDDLKIYRRLMSEPLLVH